MQARKILTLFSEFVFLSTVLLYTSVGIASTMDLKSLVEYGLENSPAIKSSKNNLKVSELSKSNSFSKFLPSLDIAAIHGYQDGDPTSISNPWAGELSLTLTETLYDNGSNFIGYNIAKLSNKKAEIEYQKDRGSFCLKVVKEYNSYSQAVELLKVQEFQYKILLKQFKSIESKYKRGEKTRTDFLRFKARLQRSSLSLKIAENIVLKSIEEIKSLIGFYEKNLSITPSSPSEATVTLNLVSPLSLEDHYEHKIAGYEKEVNDQNVRLIERKYLPEVFLTAGASYSNTDYLAGGNTFQDNRQTNWSALLTLKYNLWDWGIRRRNFSIAKIERDTSNNTIDNRLLTLKATLTKLVLDINQQKANYKLNKELVDLERKNYTSLEKEYRNGRATFLDLVNAVDNLTNAQDLFLRNHFELKSSIEEYMFHQGRLYESIVNN